MILNGQVTASRVGSPGLPLTLLAGFDSDAPTELWGAGPIKVLDQQKTGFFCSSRCPGSLVLKTFDAITRMRDEGQLFIGGFHSVMEWECLGILLRGNQPVIWVPARSIVGMRLKPELQPAFKDGRLLIISPFAPVPANTRVTATLAERRNRFVGALADNVFVAHAQLGSKTAALSHILLANGKPVFTFAEVANEHLLAMGAKPIEAYQFSGREADKSMSQE